MAKMSASEIVHTALVWGEESMAAMIEGLPNNDPHKYKLINELAQMRAYRKRRFPGDSK